MPLLQAPKRQATGGYCLALNPPVLFPRIGCDKTTWSITEEWEAFAHNMRNTLIGELLSHGNWFSRPPRRDVLEPLFAPWVGKSMQGVLQFSCKQPDVPGPGSATWTLESLTMTASAITPNWAVSDFTEQKEEQQQDTISLFNGDDDDDDEREIQFDDIELDSPAAAPTKVRNREWKTAKFLAKERVRESRLKAQIADRLAAKEESRFYTKYGDLDDDESHFSEYDLTEDEEEGSSDSDQA